MQSIHLDKSPYLNLKNKTGQSLHTVCAKDARTWSDADLTPDADDTETGRLELLPHAFDNGLRGNPTARTVFRLPALLDEQLAVLLYEGENTVVLPPFNLFQYEPLVVWRQHGWLRMRPLRQKVLTQRLSVHVHRDHEIMPVGVTRVVDVEPRTDILRHGQARTEARQEPQALIMLRDLRIVGDNTGTLLDRRFRPTRNSDAAEDQKQHDENGLAAPWFRMQMRILRCELCFIFLHRDLQDVRRLKHRLTNTPMHVNYKKRKTGLSAGLILHKL